MRQNLPILLFVLSGCASAVSPSGGAPTQCNKADRHGNYLFESTRISGNCGDIPTVLVSLDSPADPTCMSVSNVSSQGDCKFDGVTKCAAAGGGTLTITASVTQQTQDGSVLTGTATEETPSCVGTYDVKYTRK